MYDIPVLIVLFNRPDKTRLLIDSIRQVKPQLIYVAADGPRLNKIDEDAKCNEVRSVIENELDWDCVVYKFYRDENVGCGVNVSEAITWFFENEEMGIILEDDCIPLPSYFNYMKTLLMKYKDDSKIMHINGYTLTTMDSSYSYFFSKYSYSSGWASWRRAWSKFNFEIQESEDEILNYFESKLLWFEKQFWLSRFILDKRESVKRVWALKWSYAIMKNNGICITPKFNLINNIGFDSEATNSTTFTADMSHTKDIEVIIHPAEVKIDSKFDKKTLRIGFSPEQFEYRYQKILLLFLIKLVSLNSYLFKNLAKILYRYTCYFNGFSFYQFYNIFKILYFNKNAKGVIEINPFKAGIGSLFCKLNMLKITIIKQDIIPKLSEKDSSDVFRWVNNKKISSWYFDYENNERKWIYENAFLLDFDLKKMQVNNSIEYLSVIDFSFKSVIVSYHTYNETFYVLKYVNSISSGPKYIILPFFSEFNGILQAINDSKILDNFILSDLNGIFYLVKKTQL